MSASLRPVSYTHLELDGLAAIKYEQDLYKTSAGEVTPDRIKSALETYQSCVREYGPVEEKGFPLAVFVEKIVPFRHLLMGLSEAFADPVTGIGADLMDIDPNDIDGAYYETVSYTHLDVYKRQMEGRGKPDDKKTKCTAAKGNHSLW